MVAWALVVPPFLGPDEDAHFGYVQSLSVHHERPPGQRDGKFVSTEVLIAGRISRTADVGSDLSRKPAWEPSAEEVWEKEETQLFPYSREDIASQQHDHPPVYYALAVAPYRVAPDADVFERLHFIRLFSGLLMLVTALGAWLLVGELFGRDRVLQLAGATCVGLQPMSTFVSSGVNPDALLLASVSMALWLGVRLLRHGPSLGYIAAFLGAVLVAATTKAAGVALVPAAMLVLLTLALRRDRHRLGSAAAFAAIGAGIAAAGFALDQRVRASIWPELGELRGFGTYLWQFYLPRLPGQHDYEGVSVDSAWDLWVETSWAAFGSLEVRFEPALYVLFAVVAAGTFAAAALALGRRSFRPGAAVLAFFALTAAALLVGAHWIEFRSVADGNGTVMQGRYLLPLMPIAGVAVAAGLSLLGRGRAVAAALVLAGMATLQLASLGTVAGRYFA